MLRSAGFMIRAARRHAVAAVAASILVCRPLHAEDEVRALWVVRTTLTSPAAIATMVEAAKACGFNTLIVQVRGRGDSYFQNGLEPRPPALASQPAFDPLAVTIARAHGAGLQVHAWINVNLVASATELPSSREHVVYRHPEWLMVPRVLADDLSRVDPRSPEYIGRLARYVRSRPSELEGLYLSPIPPAAAAHTTAVVRDIAERYAIDGVHFDYVRYPTQDFDYSRETIAAFRASVLPDVSLPERHRYDARVDAGEPILYTQAFPERWRIFRTTQLTALLTTLRDAVKAVRPSALVTVAVTPDPREASAWYLQDWRGWIDRGLVDVVCPMAYTTDTSSFASAIAAVRQAAGPHPVWAGIGAYRLSPDQIAEDVRSARRAGVIGVILFSYDALTDPTHGPGFLFQVARAAFNQ
jgi:uncharacterized lipoprotein YddW (UPF0748 family)